MEAAVGSTGVDLSRRESSGDGRCGMDTGTGELARLHDDVAEQLRKAEMPLFHVGKVVTIEGSRFRIERIKRKKVTLRLLPR